MVLPDMLLHADHNNHVGSHLSNLAHFILLSFIRYGHVTPVLPSSARELGNDEKMAGLCKCISGKFAIIGDLKRVGGTAPSPIIVNKGAAPNIWLLLASIYDCESSASKLEKYYFPNYGASFLCACY